MLVSYMEIPGSPGAVHEFFQAQLCPFMKSSSGDPYDNQVLGTRFSGSE